MARFPQPWSKTHQTFARSSMKQIILYLCCLMPLSLSAQDAGVRMKDASKKAVKSLDKGIEAVRARALEDALKNARKALEAQPGFLDAMLLSGDAFAGLGQVDSAVHYYRMALSLDPTYKSGAWFRLAMVELGRENYQSAVQPLEEYLELVREDQKVKIERLLINTRFAADAVAHPVPFEPKNLGDDINGSDPEYSPAFTLDGDELIFSRRLNNRNEDFFITRRDEVGWTPARDLGAPINTPGNEGAQFLSADGQTLYYTSCEELGGFGSCDIYRSERQGESWSPAANLGSPVNGASWDSQPSVTPDGLTLFFASNRSGGMGGKDIWYSRFLPSGRWSQPKNVGPLVNTAGDEQSPFLHPDGATLYFSSTGHPGLGDADLFLTRLDLDGDWTEAVNLGYPINTPAHEGSLAVSADGITAYMASDREDSRGALDLYAFELPEELRPTPVTWVKARVTDRDSRKPLAAAVRLVDLNKDSVLLEASTDQDGQFLVCLPSGKSYALRVERKDYVFHSEHFELANVQRYDPYTLNIALQPVAEGSEVILRNVFFKTGSARLDERSGNELRQLAVLLNARPGIRILIHGHTDSRGEESANLSLSQARAEAVRDYLIALGISRERLQAEGHGESAPIAENDTAEGRAKNRRTTFQVVSSE